MKSQTVAGAKKDITSAKKQVKTTFTDAKDSIVALEKRAEEYVAKNPKKATAIAAGVGVAVGALGVALMRRGMAKRAAKSMREDEVVTK
ncbi:MAG TPA: hypothetical protein VK158_01310 [Acidobacteriota bacterium]|nr:hypothetical protein [Acidobacteriota bacterium]